MGEQELSERIKVLEEENSLLKSRFKRASDVLSIVGHDIKNAVNGLMGMLELLEGDKVSTDDQHKALRFAKGAAQRMEESVENYVLWSKSESPDHKVLTEGIHVLESLKDVLDIYRDRADSKGIKILQEIPENLWVLGDNLAFKAVLRNCLSNCLKYSSLGGQVIIQCDFPTKDTAEFHFINHGPVFDPKELERLKKGQFPEYRKPGTDGEKGTGIGIRLTVGFLRKMGSFLKIESSEEKTEFIFALKRIDEE